MQGRTQPPLSKVDLVINLCGAVNAKKIVVAVIVVKLVVG